MYIDDNFYIESIIASDIDKLLMEAPEDDLDIEDLDDEDTTTNDGTDDNSSDNTNETEANKDSENSGEEQSDNTTTSSNPPDSDEENGDSDSDDMSDEENMDSSEDDANNATNVDPEEAKKEKQGKLYYFEYYSKMSNTVLIFIEKLESIIMRTTNEESLNELRIIMNELNKLQDDIELLLLKKFDVTSLENLKGLSVIFQTKTETLVQLVEKIVEVRN